jgi:archaellum component FlaC
MNEWPPEGDMSAQILAELVNLKNYVGERFDVVDTRLGRVESRLDGVETRLTGVDGRVHGLERQFADFEAKLRRRR